MKPQASVYIVTRLDSFITRSVDALDWLNEVNATILKGEDCGIQAFMDSVDTLIMGRKTYKQVLPSDVQ
jgi:dihydrofolate reductase